MLPGKLACCIVWYKTAVLYDTAQHQLIDSTFVQLLFCFCFQKIMFPHLYFGLSLFSLQASSVTPGSMDVDSKPNAQSFRYSLNYPCIGRCIIINNKNFDRRTGIHQASLFGQDLMCLFQLFIDSAADVSFCTCVIYQKTEPTRHSLLTNHIQ